MTLPSMTDARAVADWFIWNHTGETCVGTNEALASDLASVLIEFRGSDEPAGLTQQQAAALGFIRGFIADHGYSPKYDEIAAGVGLSSKSRAYGVVMLLKDRGFVRTLPGRARSITIVGRVDDVSTAHSKSVEA